MCFRHGDDDKIFIHIQFFLSAQASLPLFHDIIIVGKVRQQKESKACVLEIEIYGTLWEIFISRAFLLSCLLLLACCLRKAHKFNKMQIITSLVFCAEVLL